LTDTQASQLADQIRGFFEVFSRASATLDLDALAGLFAETFLSSDPAGTTVVPRPAFLQALPRRAQAFAEAGVGPAVLTRLTHTELDPHHVLARTTWAAPRIPGDSSGDSGGGGEVRLESSFLLRRDGDLLRVIAYITHEGLRS
jgi:hypothetical protein